MTPRTRPRVRPKLLPLLTLLSACTHHVPLPQGPPEVPPEVRLVVDERTYPVQGVTLAAIGRSMEKTGPVWQGVHVWGLTRWGVRWGWRSTVHEGTCRLIDVRVVVRVEITLPEWQDAARASSVLALDWRRFHAALQRHELEHRDLGLEAGAAILETLRKLRAPDCVEMAGVAEDAARSVLRRYQRRNELFEMNTRFGKTEGAVWPPA